MTINFSGVAKNTIGKQYNCALGYDDGDGNVNMVGYVIPAGTVWEQDTNLQDESSLISVASPNQIDRNLTTWPRITQGDWSKGEQQLTFIDPAHYRSSDGNVDVSTPGILTLLPSARTTTKVQSGAHNLAPLATDGGHWFLGYYKNSSVNFMQGDLAGYNPPIEQQVADGTEVLDILYFAGGLFVGTATGIWQLDDTPEPGNPTSTPKSTIGVSQGNPNGLPGPAAKSMAYYAENVYFIDPTNTIIYSIVDGDTTPATFQTKGAGNFEQYYNCLCSTANGLFITTRGIGGVAHEIFYFYDGSSATLTRIGDIWGRVLGAAEMYGYTYIVAALAQRIDNYDLTLYQLSGSTLTQVQGADFRWVAPEFQAKVGSLSQAYSARGSVYGDGRYLYIGWPGLYGMRIDINQGGVSRVGATTTVNQVNINSHQMIYSNLLGVVDVGSYGTTLVVNEYFENPTTGIITLSDFDWDTPAEDKDFKAFYIELNEPLDPGASVSIAYAVDGSTTYLPTTFVSITTTTMAYLLPPKSIGRRISTQITMTADPASHNSPSIRSVAAEATLARVWKATLQCHENEQLLDGTTDDNNAKTLASNIQNAYDTAGRQVYMYVPSLTDPTDVELITGTLNDYSYKAPGPAIQGTIDITVKETG